MNDLSLPVPLGRGKIKPERRERYDAQVEAWCHGLLLIQPRLEFDPGVRGWCYILEHHGLSKGDFDRAEELINRCRKSGLLPLNFTNDDSSAKWEFSNVEKVIDRSPDARAADIAAYVDRAHLHWEPVSLWDFQNCYVEMVVEKSRLRACSTRYALSITSR